MRVLGVEPVLMPEMSGTELAARGQPDQRIKMVLEVGVEPTCPVKGAGF